MSRFLLFIALCILAVTGPAAAQEPLSRFENAMDAHDYAGAEEIVAEELAREQANDPSSAETGDLARTLASLRVLQENYAAAIEPAQQALRIAQVTGGDLLPIRLLVARAELGNDGRREEAATLRRLVLEAGTRPELAAHVHHGAMQVAEWAMIEGRYDEALAAWRIAAPTSDASLYGPSYARGVALIGETAASLYTSRPGALDLAATQGRFEEGLRLLRRLPSDNQPFEVSRGEQAYAQAMAWYRVWRAYAQTRRFTEESAGLPPTGFWDEPFNDQISPFCNIEVLARPSPRLPTDDDRMEAAAAVLWLRFSREGEVLERRVMAIAGGNEAFAASVRSLAPRWRIEGANPPACSVPSVTVRTVVFRFRE